MQEIKELVEHMKEELEDSQTYADLAIEHKGENNGLSALYLELANQETRHMEMLHDKAVELITAHRREHGEPPAAMLAVWDYEHKKIIRKATEVRAMLEMIKK
jgi:hypothetical protein